MGLGLRGVLVLVTLDPFQPVRLLLSRAVSAAVASSSAAQLACCGFSFPLYDLFSEVSFFSAFSTTDGFAVRGIKPMIFWLLNDL